ncbi:AraC family transcriptional regulator [Corallincola spongiicola]|uniref:AraC family transcriptional regulator n=1 Tax=Corallincola spongiicola TaxID=2520508 RepID=A0ABY1WM08_9GAMM|nr:AraC family transcriptional regulator [Corallincola spongiicola]TAA41837.1 AraC family transcriptional regulator [Corallincola spongiicola]
MDIQPHHQMTTAQQTLLCAMIEKMQALTPELGLTVIEPQGITLIRAESPTERNAIVCQPFIYVVIQGKKASYLGDEKYSYDPLNFLALSVSLPLEAHVIEASPETPYLAIKIDISTEMVSDLLLHLPTLQPQSPSQRGICVCPMSIALMQTIDRLLSVLTEPKHTEVLAPLCIKEALYHALLGPQGPQLAAFASQGRQHQRIAEVIRHIQQHYEQPLDVDGLATIANMSPSSLHQHFKAVTNASPLQYIKTIRLHHAHQLVTVQQTSISQAAYQVGYQSVSQFSREYKRLFGQVPSEAKAS